MVESVTSIKSVIKISVGVSVKIQKNITCAKKFIFLILQHVAAQMVNMQEVLVI